MDAILKESHENRWLEQGWYLALQFTEGWGCFRITGREPSGYRPVSLGALATLQNLTVWNELIDAQSRHFLEPPTNGLIYHHFWGVSPAKARIFLQFPPRADVGSLISQTRTISGDIGYIDGDTSPFNGPLSVDTELFTVKERYPAFQAYNPLADPMDNIMLQFDTMKYRYTIVKDRNIIRELLVGQRKVRKYTMGQVDPKPMSIPAWLKNEITGDLLEYGRQVMEAQV